ncbi:hypothetical protein K9L67_02275 [Candidatus Woesearchaeota archaeon]|nr:hypothetical protein [Candidatus Woesearchaeota archaeon]MCF7901031.1 hypothetical protein [Candidatus Woesearchaeota archaeon]MCF8013388.1 hypothetical protein [Candidatus Woesearchaeota archaeon]
MKFTNYGLLILIFSLFFIAGCSINTQNTNINKTHWKDIELKDVKTSENFKVSDFEGKKVFLETFAVYCSNCKNQQDELKTIYDEDELIIISLNTDPSEDENKIKEHIEKNNYSWKYSIAPVIMTERLMEEFGFIITQSAQAPIVLVCEDGSYSLLPTGIKNAEKLEEAIELGC